MQCLPASVDRCGCMYVIDDIKQSHMQTGTSKVYSDSRIFA
jgi:hypothetical protein